MKSPAHLTDTELVQRILKGDDAALGILYAEYVTPVFSFISRLAPPSIDPQDIVQQAFIKAWQHLKQYDSQYPFRTWIFTIARNTLRDQIRKKTPTAFSDLDTDEGPGFEEQVIDEHSTQTSDLIDQAIDQKWLDQALQQLPLSQKEVVLLHVVEQLTFQEIADSIKQPMDTVKTRYRRAIQKLKISLASDKKRFI